MEIDRLKIHVSPSALEHLQQMVAKQKGKGFRLSIKKTGCSGFAYVPEVIQTINNTDLQLNIQGLTVLVDPKWTTFFENMTIDFIEDTKSGLKQKKLVFINQKEASRCGCGESFQLTSEEDNRA